VAASVLLRAGVGVNAETSLWVYFLSPVATLCGVVVGFFLAKVQGRSQTRYVKSAEYITRLRKLLLDVRWAFEVLPEYEHESDDEIGETAALVGERVMKLVSFYETYVPWLPQRTRDSLEQGLILTVFELGLPFVREEDEPLMSREKFNRLLEQLKNTNFVALADELDNEVEHLVGTLPWRQRFSRVLRRFSVS
jgi:hypothetical protein